MKKLLGISLLFCALATILLLAPNVMAAYKPPCDYDPTGALCPDPSPSTGIVSETVVGIVNFLLIAVGILAVIMIIVSAVKITTSAGDAEKVKSGKNTLLWSIVGLALALLAGIITNVAFYLSDPSGWPTN